MEILILIAIILYILSTVSYVAYLFLQKDHFQKTGYYLIAAGFVFHTLATAYGFILTGHIPVSNLFETLSIACLAIAGVFLVFQYRFKLKILGIFAAPLISLVMVMASQLPKQPVQVVNIYKSVWFLIHIIAIFVGEAAFALAFGVGLLYLIQERAIKTKNPGFFFRRLPSLELLDHTGYGCIITGFTMLSLGLVTGFVYAKAVWGKFWSWDPKEVWAGITWLLYAALLHQRLTVGWRGRRAAIMAIIGFAAVLFTFFGVNFLLKGHHGEFTRW